MLVVLLFESVLVHISSKRSLCKNHTDQEKYTTCCKWCLFITYYQQLRRKRLPHGPNLVYLESCRVTGFSVLLAVRSVTAEVTVGHHGHTSGTMKHTVAAKKLGVVAVALVLLNLLYHHYNNLVGHDPIAPAHSPYPRTEAVTSRKKTQSASVNLRRTSCTSRRISAPRLLSNGCSSGKCRGHFAFYFWVNVLHLLFIK
ncbi:uncharacterized protein LOC119580652 [Penaeus monodon]|uniref:uncharacterized protein LOC119580652 n=1 Tax=Penaeus monodon TaxID=6687 RepID=UPI0018A6D558|nr:uncharacterized protein LOC119580652 [Penaeus monodon]